MREDYEDEEMDEEEEDDVMGDDRVGEEEEVIVPLFIFKFKHFKSPSKYPKSPMSKSSCPTQTW